MWNLRLRTQMHVQKNVRVVVAASAQLRVLDCIALACDFVKAQDKIRLKVKAKPRGQ